MLLSRAAMILVVFLLACADTAGIGELDQLAVFQGAVRVEAVFGGTIRTDAPSGLGVGLTLTNLGNDSLIGRTGYTNYWFEAFDSAARTGTPLWSGHTFNGRQPAIPVRLGPGDSVDLGGGKLRGIGSLPAGTYYFRAAIVFDEPAMRTRFVPAGEVQIEEQ